MSGHSKWSSIKHKKGAKDAKRGKLFTKLIREITVAAKMGGGEVDANPRLRLAVTNARASNMPLETVNRAIQKGVGGNDGVDYVEITYEGYGPSNIAVVVETLTDNRNRTVASIRHAFTRYNGTLGSTNSVQFMFDQKGTMSVSKAALDEDTLTEYLIEAGADDFEDGGDVYSITCAVEQFETVRKFLDSQGLELMDAGLAKIPQTSVVIESVEKAEQIINFLETLEEDDDVQKVYSNMDIAEEVLTALQ